MQQQATEANQQYEALVQERRQLKTQFDEAHQEMNKIKSDFDRLDKEKKEVGKAKGKLAGYGRQMEELCNEIERQKNQFEKKPLGPLGVHVTINPDSEEWAGPVENAIGSSISNFIVTCHKDRQLLQSMCKRFNCTWVTIVTMRPDQAKHNVRLPTVRGIKSVAQCISVDDPLVWNALVDWAKIDTSAVFSDHNDAHRALIRDRFSAFCLSVCLFLPHACLLVCFVGVLA